ncbi:MAG: FG-GAP repeat domain-containing protein [Planctomycetaceae bacterium]
MAARGWFGRLFDSAAAGAQRRARRRSPRAAAGPEALEPRQMFAAGGMRVGMNVESVVDWSPAWTFTDAFQASRPWIAQAVDTASGALAWDVGATHPLAVDARGEVERLATWSENGRQFRQQAATLLFRDAGGYQAGTYHAQWEGTGTVTFGFDARVVFQATGADGITRADLAVAPSDSGILVRIEATDPADPVRGIHVWMPDWQGRSFAGEVWRPGAGFSPFHPLFLERLAPFSTIRFMPWQETNGSTIRGPADARPADAARQSSGPGGSPSEPLVNGVSVEHMVQLANDLDADAWFNMPARADDAFVRAFAETVRDRLEPGRRVHVEWANEIWNYAWGFDGARVVDELAARPEHAGLDRWQVAGREAKRDFDIWTQVFAGQTGRLVRVVAGQAANEWIVDRMASAMGGSFDALAIAPYFAPADEVREAYTAATTVDTVLADSRAAIATSIDWTRRHAALAAQWSARLGRPIGLVAYEGGAHLDGRGGPAQQAFYEASNDPRMGELYAEYLAGLEAAGLELYVDFQFTGQAGAAPWGDFAKLHRMDEPLATAWRYAAVAAAAAGGDPEPPARPPVRPTIDLDGDGLGDLVWRDAATGAFVGWLLDAAGATRATRGLGGGAARALVALGDLDGDGVSDQVWRSAAGATSVSLVRADGTVKGGAGLGVAPAWRVESIDDFDGDGRDDLVWRHTPSGATAIWLMDGARVRGKATVGGDRTWRIVGTSGRYDADGDGRADLLWRHGGSGATVLWLMDGTVRRATAALGGDLRAEVVATLDADGDGRGDLVWRDRRAGTLVLRLMDAATQRGQRVLAPAAGIGPAATWSVVATVAAGGAGRPGIVVRESLGPRTVAWWMAGVEVAASTTLSSNPRLAVLRRPGRTAG